jgi:hypothetical protein
MIEAKDKEGIDEPTKEEILAKTADLLKEWQSMASTLSQIKKETNDILYNHHTTT